MTNEDKNISSQPDQSQGNHNHSDLAGQPATAPGDQADRNEVRTSPLGRQLVLMALIVAVLIGVVMVMKSRSKPNAENAAGGSALNPNQVIVARAAAEAVELKTAKVTLEPGVHVVRTNGTVHFSPYDTINVSPKLTGKIRTVYVKVGDHVTAGQPLADMINTDSVTAIDTARDADEQLKLTAVALDTARKQFKLGTPEVTAAEATLIQAHESTLFNKRMLDLTQEQNGIGGFTDKPLTDAQSAAKQADTQLAQDLKDLELAQKQYDRTAKLFSIGVAAKQDVETAEDTLGKAKDAVANDREQSRIAHVTVDREQKAYNTRLYANQTVRQAETNYQQAVIAERAAATALRMVKAALYHDLKQAEHDYQAAVADAHAAHTVLNTYDNPTAEGLLIVRSPASGVITARNVNPGQMVDQTGETPWQMFTIVNSSTVYVDAAIYEKDMVGVRVGQRVTATSDALPAHFAAAGIISFVSPGLDPTAHTLSVRAEMDNRSGLLKDGMYVSTKIDLGATSPFPAMPVVPMTAVVHDGDNDYVFIAEGDGKYDRRQVTLGEQRGEGDVAITKGLKSNETIVTHGALYLGTGGTAAD
jgi:RND family efflux transporter MFP subunit